jgi:hypothetical protein
MCRLLPKKDPNVANLMTKTGHTSRVHLAILSVRAGVAGR